MALSAQQHKSNLYSSPRPFQIPELLEAIASHLHRSRDLLSLACTSKLLTDCCLRHFWAAPDFPTSPLICMLATFPAHIRVSLEDLDENLIVPTDCFERFDYYARFVRSLTLWHDAQENRLALILSRSRPSTPFFPFLTDLHLGASEVQIITASCYFSTTLETARLNYWSLPLPSDEAGNREVRDALLKLCNTPTLRTFDLMDAEYVPLESDQLLVNGFVKLATQLQDLRSRSFTMLAPVFNALSQAPRLQTLLLDLHCDGDSHISESDVINGFRCAFPSLRRLFLSATLPEAIHILSDSERALEGISVAVEGPVEAIQLNNLITRIFIDTPSLRTLYITSGNNLECEVDPPIRMYEAIQPLLACHNIRDLKISIPFENDQIFTDDEITTLFKAWPDLTNCVFESDPSGDMLPPENEPTTSGLSLKAVVAALRYCLRLTELGLPFLNTEAIPDSDEVPISYERFSLRISRSHVHNLAEVANFVTSIRPMTDVSASGCESFAAARVPNEDFDLTL